MDEDFDICGVVEVIDVAVVRGLGVSEVAALLGVDIARGVPGDGEQGDERLLHEDSNGPGLDYGQLVLESVPSGRTVRQKIAPNVV